MAQAKWWSLALVLFLHGTHSGCSTSTPNNPRPPTEKRAAEQQAVVAKEQVPPKKGRIIRTRDLIQLRPLFRQLGLAYSTHEAQAGKSPQKKEDLLPYLQGANELIDMLDKGEIIFYYGVNKQQMEKGASATVLAYEAEEDASGRRLVLMGDGTVQEMSNAEFDKAPKAAKK